MSATFPPLGGGSGSSSAGLVPGQSVASFIPDASGNAPAGWAFLDGTVSSGYDQGAALSDVIPTAPVYESGQFVSLTESNILTFPAADRIQIYRQFEGGYAVVEKTLATSEGVQATLSVGGYNVGSVAPLLAFDNLTLAGLTLAQAWTNILSVLLLSRTETPTESGVQIDIEVLVHYTTADSKTWLLKAAWSTSDFTWVAGTPLELTNTDGNTPAIFVGRDADSVVLITLETVGYTYEARRLDLATMSLTSMTLTEDIPGTLNAGALRCSCVSNGLVALSTGFDPDRVLLRSCTVTETSVAVQTLGSTDLERYSGFVGSYIPLSDGNFWSFGMYETKRLDPTTLSVAMVAGRHPALSRVPQSYEYHVLAVSLADDLLNGRSGFALAYRDRALAGDAAREVVRQDGGITLGSMFASFVRKAVYTG